MVAALLVTVAAIIIGIVYYKNRKQLRTSAKQEIQMPEYAEISFDSKDTTRTPPHSQSQTVPIKMQKNVVYGIQNPVGIAQHHRIRGRVL